MGVKEQVWELFIGVMEQIKNEDENIIINYDAKELYCNKFDVYYTKIKQAYMNEEVIYLDRHKVAAIIILALISSDAVKYSIELSDSILVGKYKVAFSVGLSYMTSDLNGILSERGLDKIEKYIIPTVFLKDTTYMDVTARNLWILEQCGDDLALIIDLADKLFLLEYITLAKYGIDDVL